MGAGYTTKELAEMKLPGFPGTPQGWDKLVKTKQWAFVEGRGRGRGGVRREYLPPPDVQLLIQELNRGSAPSDLRQVPFGGARDSGALPASGNNVYGERCFAGTKAHGVSDSAPGSYAVGRHRINVDALAAIIRGVMLSLGGQATPEKVAAIAAEFYAKVENEKLASDEEIRETGKSPA